MNYQNFQFLNRNIKVKPFKLGWYYFSKIVHNNTNLLIQTQNYTNAHKSYIRTREVPRTRSAIPVRQTRNSANLPEFEMYGFTWIANEVQPLNQRPTYILQVWAS